MNSQTPLVPVEVGWGLCEGLLCRKKAIESNAFVEIVFVFTRF